MNFLKINLKISIEKMVAFRQKATHRKEGETIDKRNNSSFRLLISNLLSCGKKFQIANEHESKRLKFYCKIGLFLNTIHTHFYRLFKIYVV